MSRSSIVRLPRVLVTGASGFVGRELCRRLIDGGMVVRAAVRHAAANLPDGVERMVIGDIGPETDWRPALSGIDCVAHLAARVHLMGANGSDSAAEYRRVNTDGTLALARQAAELRVLRLVFVSSIKVNGETTTGRGPFTADDRPEPRDAYAVSKWEAEQGLMGVGNETGLEIVILRPPLVYGPKVAANFLRLMTWIYRGTPLPLSAVHNLRSLLYVGNLASALSTCLSHPVAAGKTYLVSDGAAVSTAELVAGIARALGVPDRSWPLPTGLLRLIGTALGRRDQIARVSESLVVDDTALRLDLGWQPPHSMEEGLRITAEWLRSLR